MVATENTVLSNVNEICRHSIRITVNMAEIQIRQRGEEERRCVQNEVM